MDLTIIVEIRPEVWAELARQAAARGGAPEAYAAGLLEEAMHIPSESTLCTGQELIDACSKVQGLLTDGEIDRMFARDP